MQALDKLDLVINLKTTVAALMVLRVTSYDTAAWSYSGEKRTLCDHCKSVAGDPLRTSVEPLPNI